MKQMSYHSIGKAGVSLMVALLFVIPAQITTAKHDENLTSVTMEYDVGGSLDETIFVDDDFTPETPGWGVTHFNTITNGLNAANVRDTVFVSAGFYFENIVIRRTLSLIGEDRDQTFLIGVTGGTVVRVVASSVSISGFTISDGSHGIDLSPHDIYPVYYTSISQNNIEFTEYGIYGRCCFQNTIFENNIRLNEDTGVYFESCGGNSVYHNVFTDNVCNAYDDGVSDNTWDDGYLHAGNYWDDHPLFVDECCGPDQNYYGGDGICDTSYAVNDEQQIFDRYPLMDSQRNVFVETISGTVQYITLEGGFYGIVADDGRHFDPYNLPANYRIHGLNVEFSGRILFVAGYHMWGESVFFSSIRQIGVVREESYMCLYNEGVYKSLYGGTSWFPVNTGLPSYGPSHPVNCIAGGRQAGLNRGELYAGTRSGVYKTMNGGGSWVCDGLSGHVIRDLDIVPQTERVYAATDYGLYTRDPTTHEWELVAFYHDPHTPEIPLNAVNVLHVSVCYAEPNVVYVAGYQFHCRGTWVYKSIDAGVTWTTSNRIFLDQPGVPGTPTEFAVSKFDSRYAFVGALGDSIVLRYYARTVDGSITWQYDGPDEFLSTLDLVADPVLPGVVYIAIFDPVGSSIWESLNNGDAWTMLSSWSFGADIELGTHPTNRNILYAAFSTGDGTNAYACFGKTSNNGHSWQFYNQGLPSYVGVCPRVTGFVVDLPTMYERREIAITSPSGSEEWAVRSTYVIEWESEVAGKVIISLSTDSGATWTQIGSTSNKVGKNVFKYTVSEKFVSSNCRIKVEDAILYLPSKEYVPYDISFNDFSIVKHIGGGKG